MTQPIPPARRKPKANAIAARIPTAPSGQPDLPMAGIAAASDGLESLERYADFYDFSPSGFISLERSAAIVQINLSGAQLLGLERERCIGKHLDAFVESADRDTFNTFLQQVFATDARQSSEIRLAGKRHPPIDVHIDAMLAPDKTICRMALTDITERKLTSQALHDTERRYAALFAAAPVPMYVFASDTLQFLAVNPAAIECYGYSAGEFLSMTIFDIRIEVEHSLLRKKLADGSPRRQGTWCYRRKDGSVFTAQAVVQAVEYAGRAARFVVVMDVTAQVKAEKEVAEHLFTLQRAADAAQAITWHQTLKGTLQEVADQARGVIGAHQAVVNLRKGDAWDQATNTLSLSDKYAQYRDLHQAMDGSGIYALVCKTNQPMRLTQAELEVHPRWRGFGRHAGKHPALRGWLAVPLTRRDGKNIGLLQLSDKFEGEFTQTDEYVALELAQLASGAIENARLIEEVGQLNSGLEQKVTERTTALRLANQELESFSYSVSHDLRAPLNTISGFSQLLAKQLDASGNEKLRHYLSRIQAGAAQMGQLIADLLALSRVSRTPMQHELVDLSALARSVLDDLQAHQNERQVALRIESGLQAMADEGLVRVVLENLLGNAWKYSSKQVEAKINFGQQLVEAGEPVFFVRDNGAGFDMAYADKLFTPFQRLHSAEEYAGTGIGLATVKRVIDRHGGRLWAEATPGLGATFFFTLPKGAAAAEMQAS